MSESQTNLAWDVLLDLAHQHGSLSERLTSAVRAAIRDGRLPHLTALPPSRTLAAELDVSRWTVTRAYGQLVAEGYLDARTGSATRVRWTPEVTETPVTSSRPVTTIPYDMMPGRPDLRAFPRRRWLQALGVAASTASYVDLDYPQAGGVPRLRTVLASYLNRVRGAAVEPDSVHVCFGAGQGMLRICAALRAQGHTAIGVENPGPTRLWHAADQAGLDLVPLPVDDDGLVVSSLDQHRNLRAVCVGAAHQFPSGAVLAPGRRADLLDWAKRVDGLIVEDDWDAEFRYDRPATAAMQGMEPRRVALIGSVSKTLGPAVGIGWLVAPPRWLDPLRSEDQLLMMPPALNQLALASLLDSGGYDRHLRAARSRFRNRRDALIAALQNFPDCRVRAAEAGLHLLLELPQGVDAQALKMAVRQRGLYLCHLDDVRMTPDRSAQPTLLLGYGNLADHVIDDAVDVLGAAIRRARTP